MFWMRYLVFSSSSRFNLFDIQTLVTPTLFEGVWISTFWLRPKDHGPCLYRKKMKSAKLDSKLCNLIGWNLKSNQSNCSFYFDYTSQVSSATREARDARSVRLRRHALIAPTYRLTTYALKDRTLLLAAWPAQYVRLGPTAPLCK